MRLRQDAGAALLNGEPAAPVLFADRGLHFGDGLFETLSVTDGVPRLWGRHFSRLQHGCKILGLVPPDEQLLSDEAARLCVGRERAVLKIIVTAGPVEQGYARPAGLRGTRWLQCTAWPAAPLYRESRPARLQTCTVRLGAQPMLAGLKHLNRLEQVMARRELRAGFDEGLMFNQDNQVVEGISSNLLVRAGDEWLTPKISDCGVRGVVRALVMQAAEEQGQPVRELCLARGDLFDAEALYVTNSLLGIRRVAVLDQHEFVLGPEPGWILDAQAACFSGEATR